MLVVGAWTQDVLGLVVVSGGQNSVPGSLGESLEGPQTSVSTLVGGARSWVSWLRVCCVSGLGVGSLTDGLGPAMASVGLQWSWDLCPRTD